MKPKQNNDHAPEQSNGGEQTKLNTEAFEEAQSDISQDPELKDEPEPGDDLDEGELATFEGEE